MSGNTYNYRTSLQTTIEIPKTMSTEISRFFEKIREDFCCWQGTASPVDNDIIGWWTIAFVGLTLIVLCLMSNRRITRPLGAISNHLLLVSTIIWVGGVVVYLVGFYHHNLNGFGVIPRAVISSFKMFVVSHDLARVSEELREDRLYMSVFSILHFLAAFIAFILVFRLIGFKMKTTWNMLWYKWWYARNKEVHIFWGVNEASLLLAEDIRRNPSLETIIFVDIDEEYDDPSQKKASLLHITNTATIKYSDIARIEAMKRVFVGHCYNGPAGLSATNDRDVFKALNLRNIGAVVRKSPKASFYFLSDNEVQNIAGALILQRDKMLCNRLSSDDKIYVHARRGANNEVFDHYSQYNEGERRVDIKIVDSAYLSVATLKSNDRALPVNCVVVDKVTGLVDTPFTSLIVGFGNTGQEAFKFLYEFGTFVGSDMKRTPFKCHVIDERMDRIEGLIRSEMPGIGGNELSLIRTAVDTPEFWNKIADIIKDLNYVVITLNNDTVGLSLAVNLFKYALKHRPVNHPMMKIMLRCYDHANELRMCEVAETLNTSVAGRNVEIRLFGKAKELYTCDNILSDAIMREAKEFHKVYENSNLSQWEKDFGPEAIPAFINKEKEKRGIILLRYHAIYDINRRIEQNIANSRHCRTKMILMGFDEKDLSERLKLYYGYVNTRQFGTTAYNCSDEDARLLRNMAVVEHERWIASHRLMGYTYDATRDYVKKHHECICPWENLDEVTQSYDCNVVDTTIKMAYNETKQDTQN